MFVKGEFVSLRVRNTEAPEVVVKFVVGKRVAKKAVLRNKIKRRMRAVVSKFKDALKPGADIAVFPSVDIAKKSFEEIHKEIEKVFKKAHLL